MRNLTKIILSSALLIGNLYVASHALETPFGAYKDGYANSAAYTGNSRTLIVRADSKAWMSHAFPEGSGKGLQGARLQVYVKDVVHDGVLKVYLAPAIGSLENQTHLSDLVSKDSVGSVVLKAVDHIQHMVEIPLSAAFTKVIQDNAYAGLVLESSGNLDVELGALEGDHGAVILLNYNSSSTVVTANVISVDSLANKLFADHSTELRGPTGTNGSNGAKGDNGLNGKDGPQGPKGDSGARGPQGIRGDKGDPGAVGAKGEPGNAGSITSLPTTAITGLDTFVVNRVNTNLGGKANLSGANFTGNVGIGTTNPTSALTISKSDLGVVGGGQKFEALRINSDYSGSQRPTNIGLAVNVNGTGNALRHGAVFEGGGAVVVIDTGAMYRFAARGASSNPGADLRWALTGDIAGNFGIRQEGNNWSNEGTRLTIDRSGNVGIGTTTPNAQLTLGGGAVRNGINMISDGNGNAYHDIGFIVADTSVLLAGKPLEWDISMRKDGAYTGDATGPTMVFYAPLKGSSGHYVPLAFKSNGDVILQSTLNSATAGKVGIGVVNPQYALDVAGQVQASNVTVASDVRYKQNISTISNGLEKALALRGVTYDWNLEKYPNHGFTSDKQIGFIAQEVEPIIPEMVSTDKEGYKSIDYAKVGPILVEAMKSQQKQIESQQNQITELKSLICLDHPQSSQCK